MVQIRKVTDCVLSKVCLVRQPTITRGIFIALALSVTSLLCFSYYISNFHFKAMSRAPPEPRIKCNSPRKGHAEPRVGSRNRVAESERVSNLRIDNKVMVFVETQYSRLGQEIVALLEANRVKFKVAIAGRGLPYLIHKDKGKYGVIVFENIHTYSTMESWNRQLLDKYCREYDVGMIAFYVAKEDSPDSERIGDFPLTVSTNLALRDFELNARSDVLRILRAGEIAYGDLPDDNWSTFSTNHTTYEPIAYAKSQTPWNVAEDDGDGRGGAGELRTVAVQDFGRHDGIRRVIFGHGLKFWLIRVLALDSLSYLSRGKFAIPLERHVLIDVDDIFVGKKGTRLRPDDVEEMLKAQERIQQYIPGFHFNLGFSGKYYHHGYSEENKGDDLLLANKHKFWWFGHMWRHLQPHKVDSSRVLERELSFNKQFAKEKGIVVNNSYAVAPHHSGVYPVHEQLYESWKSIWGIKVTSTEEYPHLNPARFRRGFIHHGIMVLPRQTCGLYTHTIHIDKYPGGRIRLDQSIRGGELFQTIVYNPFSIFMTHQSNYAMDRLALYTFESVFKFVQCWTNIKLRTVPPKQLGEKYFKTFPDEVHPIWQNPCDDKRHSSIWSLNKTCSRLPKFLVIGPQKTGTTALYTFLSMHPSIISNRDSKDTFEEVQFFNGKNYFKGLDWYMKFFPIPSNSSKVMMFEKSASYFDIEMVPSRAFALLHHAKIICILISPSKRAYSWYQHMRSHKDRTALKYSFYEVVTADDSSPPALRVLRHRCLNPGFYAQHLERWLSLYTPKQLLVLDGEQLKLNPVATMRRVQRFLRIEPYYPYEKHLKYDPKKGFYCQVVKGDHTRCLGRGKGRKYPAMEYQVQKKLNSFYKKHNIALSKLLNRLGYPQPSWLQEELAFQ
ncbi:bifunctional heparan sulfate N-deacetylase/N-sulfotransferase-like [Tubulanus polymorphus]|uniref:bifunctional heparan sulfate N-deacetylase/N-sulfotransferase-like n=1 Tax=Tubulanus polymorphus TaxID=672921 RepID=UPI003DA1D739